MATGLVSWSQTASANATADSTIAVPEGMAPSGVNDAIRALMASMAKFRDDNNGTLVTGGTSTAYTLTSNQGFASHAAMDGATLRFALHATNGAGCTLSVDGLAARNLVVNTAGTNLPGSAITAGRIVSATYKNSILGWIIHSGV